MGYVNRTNRTTYRRAGNTRRILRGKPTINKNKSAIYTLTKKVNQIAYKQRERTLKLMFSKQDDFNLASSYNIRQLFVPKNIVGSTGWFQVFGTNTNASESRCLKVDSVNIQYQLYPSSEESLIDHTVMILTPKSKKVFDEVFNPVTGAIVLTNNVDYVMIQGVALINKDRFKVHHYKRNMTVQQDGGSGTQELGYPIPSNICKVNLNLGWKIKNTVGPWTDVDTNTLPYYMRMFMVCFNNNSAIDLEYPALKYTVLFKTTAVGV